MKLLMENWRKFLNEKVNISDQEAAMYGQALGKAYEGGPAAVRQLMNSDLGKSIKFRKFLGGSRVHQKDGAANDDVVKVTKGVMPVAKLIPTQKFIDLNQSVGFPLGSAESLLKNITAKKGHGPITVSGPYIIDGHHRWSGISSVAQDGTISVINLDFKGDPSDKLSSAQIAVGAVDVRPQDEHPSKGGEAAANILGAPASDIYGILDKYQGQHLDKNAPGPILGKQMLQQIATDPKYRPIWEWAGYQPDGDQPDLENLAEAIKMKVSENLAQLNKFPAGAPDRPDMPQMDHDSIGGSAGLEKIKARIAKGDINLSPPFSNSKAAE